MTAHRRLLGLWFVMACIGCGNGGGGETPDLSVGGGGGRDLSVAQPEDMSVALDLAVPRDLLTGVDGPVATDPVLKSLKFETPGPISLAVDDSGAPVIAGGLINSSRFGDITLAAQAMAGQPAAFDLFFVKFDGSGKSVWGQRYGDGAEQSGSAVAINQDGIALVAGPFTGDMKFKDGLVLSSPNETNYVAAINVTTKTVLWAKVIELGPGGFVLGMAADPTDHSFVVAATATAAVTFDTFSGTAGGGKDVFVAKVKGDDNGTLVWARQIGGTGDQSARAVAVDATGNAFVVGQFAGVLDFGDGPLPKPATGAKNMFISKLDGAHNGAALKTIAIGGRGIQLAQSVAVDPSGNVVIAGYLAGGQAVTFDASAGIVLTPAGQDGFVAKLDPALSKTLWARRIGDVDSGASDGGMPQASDPQEATAVAVDHLGNVVVAGYFQGTVDFGVGAPATALKFDAFALKLAGGSGVATWVRSTHGSEFEKASAVVCSKHDDSVWVVGTFNALTTSPSIPNWGSAPMNELVFEADTNDSPTHTFLVQLTP